MKIGVSISELWPERMHSYHLLIRDESLEAVPRLRRVVLKDDRHGSLPADALGKREEVLHEGRLAGKLHLDGTVAEAAKAAVGHGLLVLLDRVDCGLHAHKLDVRIIRLASNALHNDVDGFLVVVQDLGVAAEESEDLCTLGTEGNLLISVSELLTRFKLGGKRRGGIADSRS